MNGDNLGLEPIQSYIICLLVAYTDPYSFLEARPTLFVPYLRVKRTWNHQNVLQSGPKYGRKGQWTFIALMSHSMQNCTSLAHPLVMSGVNVYRR